MPATDNRCDGDQVICRVQLQLVARLPAQPTEHNPFVDATGTIDTCGTYQQRVRIIDAGQASHGQGRQ